MNHIVTSERQVLKNITRFELEADGSPSLQERLSYPRAWYAALDDDKTWCFGPSKFIGYDGLSAAEYLANARENDGRRTEAQLGQWFVEVEPTTDLYEELTQALSSFLGKYGKAPSTKVRISVSKEFYEKHSGESEDANARLVDLLVVVANSLPKTHRANLRNRLTA